MGFLVFAGETLYPKGGAEDFFCKADSVAEVSRIAKNLLTRDDINWCNIINIDTSERHSVHCCENGNDALAAVLELIE